MNKPDWTVNALRAFALGRAEAERIGNNYLGAEHLFLGVLDVSNCRAMKLLKRLGLEIETVREAIRKRARAGQVQSAENFPVTPRVRRILTLAREQAKKLNPANNSTDTEHILLGFLIEADSLPARTLREMGVTVERVEQAIRVG